MEGAAAGPRLLPHGPIFGENFAAFFAPRGSIFGDNSATSFGGKTAAVFGDTGTDFGPLPGPACGPKMRALIQPLAAMIFEALRHSISVPREGGRAVIWKLEIEFDGSVSSQRDNKMVT